MGSQQNKTAAQIEFTQPPGVEDLFAPFWQVYDLIQRLYATPNGNPVPPERLVEGAIKGMLESLGDGFTIYLSPNQMAQYSRQVEGESLGLGIAINTNPETGEVRVSGIVVGSPAQAAGIRIGDVFVRINGEDVSGLSQGEIAARGRAPEGTTFQLTLRRGDRLLDFTLAIAPIVRPNLESRLLDGNIGYLRLRQFSPRARAEVDAALDSLNTAELDGLIFDLRGNAGGTVGSMVDIASAFVEEGVVLVEQFGDGREQVWSANGNFRGLDLPLVVLVDGRTQSAAEAFAGALQDYDLATIIGQRTFGKGVVQRLEPLVNGGGVRLTIARWLTPRRHWIHQQGIVPDRVVSTVDGSDAQLNAALQFLFDNSVHEVR